MTIHTIGYAIWDQTNLISNRFLRQYIRDTFYEIGLDFEDVHIDHDLERLIESFQPTLDDLLYTHVVVFHSGHTARSPKKLKAAIEQFCKEDFFIAGQIIHHVNSYPFLHPQMFIINMQRYRDLGCPIIGYHEDSDVLDLHNPERSPDNLHDDYTPLWLKPTGDITACVRREFGWNAIHESLNHGIPIKNLSNDIRWSKRYLYPSDRPHTFANCVEQLTKDELVAIPTRMNQNQQKFLAELLTPGVACSVYLFNTERLVEHLPEDRPIAKRLFGTASGFKLPILWHLIGEPKDVIYFDHNRESLTTWRDIVVNWSGDDFESFCKSRGYKDDFSKMQDVLTIVDDFPQLWRRFQAIEPTFMHCDILKEPERIITQMESDGNYVWYSNCFKFYEGIRRYGMAGVEKKEQQFLRLLATRPDTFCFGSRLGFARDFLQ